jgi:hypothetical protein
MTVTQMSITETTDSQHKLHWLAEQAVSWSGLPVVAVRPTIFLEGFFLLLAAASVRDADELALPMGASKTSPVSSVDVAAILDDPAPHIGHIYNLTGTVSADLDHYASFVTDGYWPQRSAVECQTGDICPFRVLPNRTGVCARLHYQADRTGPRAASHWCSSNGRFSGHQFRLRLKHVRRE